MNDFKLEKNTIQRPFLKWVGGKTQIMDKIIQKFPKEMNNYHEIFLGGGSVLFTFLSLQKNGKINVKKKIFAYDVNNSLINVYKNVRDKKEEVYTYICKYGEKYGNLKHESVNRNPKNIEEAETSKESFYYWMRKKFNSIAQDSSEASALFIVINKTCFRGVYREGPNGFNVPYGHYKTTPHFINEQELFKISELIQNVTFVCCDFSKSIRNVKKGDFCYLDPPYVPENKKNFVGYTSKGFSKEMHIQLFQQILDLIKKKNVKFLLSNSNSSLVMDTFKDFKQEDIDCRRSINSKNPASKAVEVIIYN